MRIFHLSLCISKMMLLKTDMFNDKHVQIYPVHNTNLIIVPLMMTNCHCTACWFLSTVSLLCTTVKKCNVPTVFESYDLQNKIFL